MRRERPPQAGDDAIADATDWRARAGLVASMATPQKQTGGPLFEWPAGSTVEVNKFGSRERRPVGESRLGHQRDGGFFPGFDLNLGLTLPPADEVSPSDDMLQAGFA